MHEHLFLFSLLSALCCSDCLEINYESDPSIRFRFVFIVNGAWIFPFYCFIFCFGFINMIELVFQLISFESRHPIMNIIIKYITLNENLFGAVVLLCPFFRFYFPFDRNNVVLVQKHFFYQRLIMNITNYHKIIFGLAGCIVIRLRVHF